MSRLRVRDVVAHVFSYEDLSRADLAWRFVRGRFSLNRINQICLDEQAQKLPAELIALARRCLEPRGLTAGFNGGIAWVDGMIHHQDIRRPLKLPRVIPPERLRAALDFAKTAPTIRGFGTDVAYGWRLPTWTGPPELDRTSGDPVKLC